ncbi:MAG TPA: GatB/YqeY domain-containing protein [Gammaproteobacteria bacterium]|nr:Yqey-like protein [bacterium BMS3Abin11]GMT40240.1 MAG: aspartyl-tRNA amidotransferase subunit B [bacterium]HDH08829.1 GatB/YqeY domain-containing protein [Gammaproteobacteria bacterium]HDH16920.1 GatB/YqeY domain-containing protein [Gammaproteobacteria bacterium]HDZ79335.1 GatB/YqeY domain-containing protein [Gammaproteobacteria bacterium]
MVSTKKRIASDAIQAMRDKDVVRKDTLRMLRAAIQRREVDERTELDEAQVLAVIEKQVKQARDSISQFIKGSRQDLADREQNELDILIEYLPEQMSAEEINQHVKSVIEQTGASSMKDMGRVMGMLKPLLQGRADMAAVSKSIKDLLV